MFKLKSIFALMALLVCSAAFTACNDDDEPNEDTITEQTFLRCYAVVTDLQNGNQSVCTPITIKTELNWTNPKATVSISGLSLNGSAYPNLTLSDMKWTIASDKWSEIILANPQAALSTQTQVSITNLKMRWLDRLDFAEYVGAYDPALEFSFVIDNRFKVCGSRAPMFMSGITSTTNANGESFISSKTGYTFSFDVSTQVANLNITKAAFAEKMPALDINFIEVPMAFEPDGSVAVRNQSLIPEIAGTPQPSYAISDLNIYITPGKGGTISFKCNFRGLATYEVNAKVDFDSYQLLLNNE